jgi:hypothetical protein
MCSSGGASSGATYLLITLRPTKDFSLRDKDDCDDRLNNAVGNGSRIKVRLKLDGTVTTGASPVNWLSVGRVTREINVG